MADLCRLNACESLKCALDSRLAMRTHHSLDLHGFCHFLYLFFDSFGFVFVELGGIAVFFVGIGGIAVFFVEFKEIQPQGVHDNTEAGQAHSESAEHWA